VHVGDYRNVFAVHFYTKKMGKIKKVMMMMNDEIRNDLKAEPYTHYK